MARGSTIAIIPYWRPVLGIPHYDQLVLGKFLCKLFITNGKNVFSIIIKKNTFNVFFKCKQCTKWVFDDRSHSI